MEEKHNGRVYVQGGKAFDNPIYRLAVSIIAVSAIDGEKVDETDDSLKELLTDSEIEATEETLEQLKNFLKELS